MFSIERRVTALEQGDPPAVVRPPGEPLKEFVARMGVALFGIERAAPFDEDAFSRATGPWLAAMTHSELKEMLNAIDAEQDRRAAGRRETA